MRERTETLNKIRKMADYQFRKGAGEALFPNNVKIAFSRTTGRIRHIYLKDKLLATLRPTDGMYSLTVHGARRLIRKASSAGLLVKVSKDLAPFIIRGKSVFAKHVVDADPEIRPREEVIVTDEGNRVLAIGKATLTGREMRLFKRGVAVRVRRGVAEE